MEGGGGFEGGGAGDGRGGGINHITYFTVYSTLILCWLQEENYLGVATVNVYIGIIHFNISQL